MSRRIEILRRATEVFERQGVPSTSIEDIARAVGFKREAIYYYFKSKDEILVEIILPISASLLANLRNILRADMPSVKKLRAAIRGQLGAFNPSYLEMTVALREDHFHKDAARMPDLRKVWKEYSTAWTELIVQGQERGEFKAGLQPKVVAFGILGMCNWVSRWFHPGGPVTIDEIIETYCTLTLEGAAAAPGHEAGHEAPDRGTLAPA